MANFYLVDKLVLMNELSNQCFFDDKNLSTECFVMTVVGLVVKLIKSECE